MHRVRISYKKNLKSLIEALKELIGDEFDFNAVIPMPAELEGFTGSSAGCNIMVVCDSVIRTDRIPHASAESVTVR